MKPPHLRLILVIGLPSLVMVVKDDLPVNAGTPMGSSPVAAEERQQAAQEKSSPPVG
jgi:hypothetical protein